MVDAAASFEGHSIEVGVPDAALASGEAVIVIHPGGAEAIAAYEALCEATVHSPSQSPQWIRAWIAETRPDFFVAVVSQSGAPVLALAAEVVASGPFRLARFMGGHHANGNFCPFAASSGRLPLAVLRRLVAAIGQARPDIDLLSLERMAGEIGGQPNPLLALQNRPSPNLALAVGLTGGFDAVLDRAGSRRKRKRNRAQARKLAAAGGYRFIRASSQMEAARLLDAFFSMKREQFRKMGVGDVFADAEIRGFFGRLFSESLATDPPVFQLDGLEVGGKLRAVTGASRCGSRLICEFGAIIDDELAIHSPGDFLFFNNIAVACAEGLEVYDFSVGDEPYKRLWCDTEIVHHDVIVPLSARGTLLALATHAKNRLKAIVKGNRYLWRLAKALRRRKAGREVNGEW
ncbi:acetyltransferase [Mesorhizobium sp. L-8-10]|uniref:GNAT family N-acetyltransferase n=1 Tax=Mesorhizobium sp. L-8-10 TaxID=2744523 RepID=UPI00192874B7|nr:GNAT family N-acetyltransferase [Mesorhizobium sp. L-8-10]BCH33675.1 acetyltransferase [Mesorhizobium sp. L-8-10]